VPEITKYPENEGHTSLKELFPDNKIHPADGKPKAGISIEVSALLTQLFPGFLGLLMPRWHPTFLKCYPGGLKQVTAPQLHPKDPTAIVKLAIYRMLPKNLHRRTMMQMLHLFPEEIIPEDICNNLVEELAQPRRILKRLDEYTQEEIDAFPMLWTPPKDYRKT
uniref:Uncharacterized protein n=2 Tax=Gopherus TaxID=38771 RepID=A0A8C4Y133_9SAUR